MRNRLLLSLVVLGISLPLAALAETQTVTVRSGDPFSTYSDSNGLARDAANVCTHRTSYPTGDYMTEDAYVIPTYTPYWAQIDGTSWISWWPNPWSPGMSYDLEPNFAAYESTFDLPQHFENASIELEYMADDWTDVYLNGHKIVDQHSLIVAYFQGAPLPPGFCTFSCISSTVTNDPALFLPGTNTLRFVQRDPDGAGGLDYLARVSFEPSNSLDVLLGTLQDLRNAIDNLPAQAFKNPNMRNALDNKLAAEVGLVQAGAYLEARDKMADDILAKMDGFAKLGANDSNDWIITAEGQAQVYPLAARALQLLNSLL